MNGNAPRPGPAVTGPRSADGPASSGPTVDEILTGRLAALAPRPVAEHVAGFDEMHRLLQDTLATLDEV